MGPVKLHCLTFQKTENFFKESPHLVLVLFLGGQFEEFRKLLMILQAG